MFIKTVLVGVDGSAGAAHAAAWAARLAVDVGAVVVAVHVLDPDVSLFHDLPPTGFTNWRRQVDTDLRTTWIQPVLAAGVSVQCHVLEGETVVRGLLDEATRRDADLVVLGTQGHGKLRGGLLGSVSYGVSHLADRPVVVVPATSRTEAG